MKFCGYYTLENNSHGRGYGYFEKDSLEAGFAFLWQQVLEIARNPEKIKECYIYYVDEKAEKVNGFQKKICYGWAKTHDMFKRQVTIKQTNTYYISAEKPK